MLSRISPRFLLVPIRREAALEKDISGRRTVDAQIWSIQTRSLLTWIARHYKRRCLLYLLFNYTAYRLKIFFFTLSKLVYIKMISGKRVFLYRFALIQEPWSFIHYELLYIVSLICRMTWSRGPLYFAPTLLGSYLRKEPKTHSCLNPNTIESTTEPTTCPYDRPISSSIAISHG